MNRISVYNDFLDRTGMRENGAVSIPKYNRFSRLAEMRLLDYLTGDVEGIKPPEPYNVQKLKDWITFLIVPDTKQVTGGFSPRPADYYRFESLKIIGSYLDENDCGEEEVVYNADTPIEVVDSQTFDMRQITHIKSLRPSMRKPIAKMIGGTTSDPTPRFEYAPRDLGSVKLEYMRYPVFAEIVTTVDTVYNNVIPDPNNGTDYEWPEFARNILLYFLVQQYPISTREKALTEQNELVNKSSRG